MATSTESYVAAQNGTVRLAIRALEAFWKSADLSDPVGTARALEAFWVDLIATYGEVAATLAADRFEEATGMSATMVRPVDPELAAARARWAVGPLFDGDGDAWARLTLLADELVKQPGRSTMIRSAREHGIRFARVPVGATCKFCLMLASRGAVYATSAAAGEGRKFHGNCDCRVEPVADEADLERLKAEGYDPDALLQEFLDGDEEAAPDEEAVPQWLGEVAQPSAEELRSLGDFFGDTASGGKFTIDEKIEALALWADGDYESVQATLFGDPPSDADDREYAEGLIARLDEALNDRRTASSFTVDRSMSLKAFGITDPKDIAGLTTGRKFNHAGYLATSTIEGGVQLPGEERVATRILVPAGTPAAYLERITTNKGEREVLLPRESRLEVAGVGRLSYGAPVVFLRFEMP